MNPLFCRSVLRTRCFDVFTKCGDVIKNPLFPRSPRSPCNPRFRQHTRNPLFHPSNLPSFPLSFVQKLYTLIFLLDICQIFMVNCINRYKIGTDIDSCHRTKFLNGSIKPPLTRPGLSTDTSNRTRENGRTGTTVILPSLFPQLVERLMDTYITNGNASVNDPFMGCGTTIVSAISRGYHASGTDINKIAHLVTGAKATAIQPDYLEKKVKAFLSKIWCPDKPHSFFNGKQVQPQIPEKHIERIDYWFTEAVPRRIRKDFSLYSERNRFGGSILPTCCL